MPVYVYELVYVSSGKVVSNALRMLVELDSFILSYMSVPVVPLRRVFRPLVLTLGQTHSVARV